MFASWIPDWVNNWATQSSSAESSMSRRPYSPGTNQSPFEPSVDSSRSRQAHSTPPSGGSIVSNGSKSSGRIRLRASFFNNAVYNIGGLKYSLYDLEHRVIRSTHAPLLISEYKRKIGSRLFKRTDPRREFVVHLFVLLYIHMGVCVYVIQSCRCRCMRVCIWGKCGYLCLRLFECE